MLKSHARFTSVCIATAALIPAAAASAQEVVNGGSTVTVNNGSTITQNFDSLPTSGFSSNLPDGVQFLETGTNANTQLVAGTGSSNAGDTYSLGATGSTERALGGLQSGPLIPLFGLSFTNGTNSIIDALAISFVGEQYRLGTAGRADRLDFQYAIGTDSINVGSFSDFDALDFVSPSTTGTVGLRDGNMAAFQTSLAATIADLSILPGQSFTFRFLDFNASGADDALAIDNFALTPSFAAGSAVPEPATWAMMLMGFGAVGYSMRRRKLGYKAQQAV